MDAETRSVGPDDAVVLARLHRIEALGRRRARPEELLHELRGLLRDVGAETSPASSGTEVVERRGTAPHGT